MKSLLRLITSMLVAATCCLPTYGQVSSTSSLSGTVADPTGAVIPGATVAVKNSATSAEFKATTTGNGTFTVPALSAGTYTITVTAQGFKQAVVQGVKVDAATPASVLVSMEVGTTTEVVVVQGGGEILQTQSANVSTTITGRQITELPFTSRDALDLVLLLPGTNTPGRPRTSTIDGLPKSAINITIDGVNAQDNTLKTTDGYFTYIRPRIDAVDEVTLSTSNPGAESSAEGAVQIKFVTRQGDNQLRGSVYWYHRNPALNANYWFNNRDLPPDPRTGKAPRDRVLLNQYGFRVGGPIVIPKVFDGHDRAFFFANYEEYRLPEQATRQRTIFSPDAQRGIFLYNTSQGVRQVDLMALAASNGQVSTIDPTIAQLLADIRNSTSKGGVQQLSDPLYQRFTFTNSGNQARYFPTVRFDFNLTNKHHLETVYNYQLFTGTVDFLNGTDPAFPDFPNQGFQGSNRFSSSTALRSTLTTSLVNEARFALTGGTVLFFPNVNAGQFTGSLANQAGFNLGIGAAGISSATVSTNPSRRNAPIWQFNDTLNWTRGTHSFNFGGSFTQINFWSSAKTAVPSITFGVDSNDPADSLFRAANFPGAASADLTRARNQYAVLTGRVTAINANAFLDEKTGQYVYLGHQVQRARMREMGLFAQDSWRARRNLTLNYGLRWEVQFPLIAQNNLYSQTTIADLFGVSGLGNLFKPGVLTGKPTEFTPLKEGVHAYNTDWNNFGPSFGFAWTPGQKSGWLSRLFGSGGQTVLRGGFSIAFNRDGISTFTGVLSGNPGRFTNANRSIALGNLVTNTGTDRLPVLLRERNRLGPPAIETTPAYPLQGVITDSSRTFDPNLKLPYVMSWNFGLQRELTKDTVIEVRYVGNRALQFISSYNLNETNIVENGLLNEFKLAMANLQANIAAGRGNNFRYYGPGTGTSPLPITLAYLSGVPASQAGDPARYSSSLFASSTFVNPLARQNPAPFTFAANLHSDPGRRDNALRAGLPPNFFLVNPDKRGGATITGNGGRTYYDAAVVELRRRMSKGLLVQANYAFARVFDARDRVSLRAPYYKTVGQLATPHSFKANWIHELPFGRGQWLASGVTGVFDKLVSGWEWHGTARVQSGAPLSIGGVWLVGMTREELQKALQLRFDDAGKIIYYLPDDIIENTIRANNVSATSSTGYGSRGVPSGRYIAPANSADCIEVYTGQCSIQEFVLYGPMFTRFDLSLVKRTRVNERMNVEFRAEFLNAFNNINFSVGNPANDSTGIGGFGNATFGQLTQAYRDLSTTNDPGGRLIQFVLRINF